MPRTTANHEIVRDPPTRAVAARFGVAQAHNDIGPDFATHFAGTLKPAEGCLIRGQRVGKTAITQEAEAPSAASGCPDEGWECGIRFTRLGHRALRRSTPRSSASMSCSWNCVSVAAA